MAGIFSSNDVDELDNGASTADVDMDVDVDVDVEMENENENENQNGNMTEGKEDDSTTARTDANTGEEQAGGEGAKNGKTSKKDSINTPAIPELTRADKTLDELLDLLDDPDFTPIIPDAVTDYYVAKSGLDLGFTSSTTGSSVEATKIKRLLALATQKFISDIATDAYEYSRIRSNSAVYSANNPQTRSRALLMATMAKARGTTNSNGDVGGNSTAASATSNTNAGANAGNGGEEQGEGDVAINGSSLNPTGANQNKEKVTLTIEDLSSALDEYGLNINRPQFYR
ncbi:hypothetical protein PICMEDRAFT_16898 [Pichia membranifaciens NRRL Y-2026]|uniref:Transcription initiation factor TFIID subunit 10 n=1 Tax=Pichia membranifaciens NRRL Y-2026 TaxID=763406 RepID=A0A1E3NHJ4_9ASCO|nr:hypothetical protein PICMEDRAFT_16898 [Pichia membranifaciens NRRL Y-2026]ODQ45594.1 hypothetical protein PICMEDRAFT_16898 [Pichia membranifaciens NRRL Y-2026]